MIFQLQNELSEHDFSNIADFNRFSWFVYNYSSGSYDGSGFAAGWVAEECLIYYYNLQHCSCYGPCESSPDKYTITEFFALPELAYEDELDSKVKIKVAELLGAAQEIKVIQDRLEQKRIKEEQDRLERERAKTLKEPKQDLIRKMVEHYGSNYNIGIWD